MIVADVPHCPSFELSRKSRVTSCAMAQSPSKPIRLHPRLLGMLMQPMGIVPHSQTVVHHKLRLCLGIPCMHNFEARGFKSGLRHRRRTCEVVNILGIVPADLPFDRERQPPQRSPLQHHESIVDQVHIVQSQQIIWESFLCLLNALLNLHQHASCLNACSNLLSQQCDVAIAFLWQNYKKYRRGRTAFPCSIKRVYQLSLRAVATLLCSAVLCSLRKPAGVLPDQLAIR